MRRKSLLLTADGSTPVYPVNHYSSNSEIGLGVDVLGAATYTVEHTFDNVFATGFDPATAKWYAHPTLAALSADADGRYFAPITGIRLTATGVGGGGVRLNITPGGGGL
jgi:hypothetical protein